MDRSKSSASLTSRSTGRGGRSATVAPLKRGQRQAKPPPIDTPCAACQRENEEVEATSYCKDCKENICANCIKQHSKFASMKTHVIVNRPQTITDDGPKMTPFSCPNHPDKDVDMYCVEHDEVRCGACIAVHHRDCIDTQLIEEAAKGIRGTFDMKELKEETIRAKKNMMTIRKKASQQLVTIEKHKTRIMTQVRDTRKKVDKILDEMERRTMTDLEQNFAAESKNSAADIKLYDVIIDGLSDATGLFTAKEKETGEKGIFVGVKRARVLVGDSDRVMSFAKHNFTYEPPKFSPDVRIINWLKSIGTLGSFSFRTQLLQAKPVGKYDIKLPADKKVCDIFGCRFTENGHVVLTDWDNQNVKMLNEEFQTVDSVNVEGNPHDICVLSPVMIAVTIPKQKIVQLLNISPRLQLGRQITTEDTCRGLDCHGDHLYVVCGGFKGETDGRMLVYNINGELMKTIERNNSGQKMFVCPIAVTVGSGGDILTVTDGQRGVITITTQNDVVSIIKDKDCGWPSGICTDRDNILVCCGRSNTVIQVSGFHKVGTILSQTDGIKEPHALCYDANNMRLLVALQKSNEILVFQLKHPDMKEVPKEKKEETESDKADKDIKPDPAKEDKGKVSPKKPEDSAKDTPRIDETKSNENKDEIVKQPKKEPVKDPNKERAPSPKQMKKVKDSKLVFRMVKGDNNEKLVKVVGKESETNGETTGDSPYKDKLDTVAEETKEQTETKKDAIPDATKVTDPKQTPKEDKAKRDGQPDATKKAVDPKQAPKFSRPSTASVRRQVSARSSITINKQDQN